MDVDVGMNMGSGLELTVLFKENIQRAGPDCQSGYRSGDL